jgi:alpha-galactosidase
MTAQQPRLRRFTVPKITFMGAGSTIFVRAIIGDCMLTPSLRDSEVALYDIDAQRLDDSRRVLENLNANINKGRAKITTHLGVEQRQDALRKADYVVNAIQVGGYEPSTVIDFEVPKKYGLRQTIADTLGIGGIFRSMRTIPVVMDFARDMEEVCPDAWFLNYVNPMAMITGAVQMHSSIRAVGLCHSVQGCVPALLRKTGLQEKYPPEQTQWHIAGINHMAWLLNITHQGRDIYPEIKDRARELMAQVWELGGPNKVREMAKATDDETEKQKLALPAWVAGDMVRLEIMLQFGHYVTESSEHNAEYMPYWIKDRYPELIDRYGIPLDEYPRRCVRQIEGWKKQQKELLEETAKVTREKRGHEYGSYIMEAIETGEPTRIHGSVLNKGIITNLPSQACVEVPCLVDRNGVQGVMVGDLPEQLAGLNRTNINPQLLTIEAAVEHRKDALYHAAFLDPHTSAELSLDDIRKLVDDLIEAHGDMLPKLR